MRTRIIGIEDGWFARKESTRDDELSTTPVQISDQFIVDTELMPYRPKGLREYEFDAMMKETCQRIQEINVRYVEKNKKKLKLNELNSLSEDVYLPRNKNSSNWVTSENHVYLV